MKSEKNDIVNHPNHYTFGKYEVIEVLEDWFSNDPHLWNAVKYLARAGRKNKDKEIEDLKKAIFYIERKIERINYVSKACEVCGGEGKYKICNKREGDLVIDKICEDCKGTGYKVNYEQ